MNHSVMPWWYITPWILAAIATLRLGEVAVKRELTHQARVLDQEFQRQKAAYHDSLNRYDALRIDCAVAHAQAKVDENETWLLVRKISARGQLMMGSKVLYDFRFRVRGNVPIKVKGQAPEMPEGVLIVQQRLDNTEWYLPDWYYERVGQPVPKDSSSRRVANAFGPYALLLGGGVAIHGTVNKAVPHEAIEHLYLELNERDLKVVFQALKEGSMVVIRN